MSAEETNEGLGSHVCFTCKIFGDVLLVTAVTVGTILPNAELSGAGLRRGTKIVDQLSGIPGGPGRYLVNWDQTPGLPEWAALLPRFYKLSVEDDELRDWYLTWLDELMAAEQRSTAADDWQAAQREFPGRLRGPENRERVRALRRLYAPAEWRRKGRPAGSKNRQG